MITPTLINPKILIKKNIGKRTYYLYGIIRGKYTAFSDSWDIAHELRKAGFEVKITEKEMAVGKRKPVPVTMIWTDWDPKRKKHD